MGIKPRSKMEGAHLTQQEKQYVVDSKHIETGMERTATRTMGQPTST
jgi:hypothetical protein